MSAVEYLGGLPQRQTAVAVAVTIQRGALQLKHGRFIGGWVYQLPLAIIASVELTTASEVRARNILTAEGASRLGRPQECLLSIDATLAEQPTAVILRGTWESLSQLRQEILKGRMQVAKQWHA